MAKNRYLLAVNQRIAVSFLLCIKNVVMSWLNLRPNENAPAQGPGHLENA